MADTDSVAPEGAAGPSWRASGATLPLASSRTGGNPWQQRRHRVVLLGGIDWYRCFGVSELGGRSPVDAAVTRPLRFFVDPPLSAFVSVVFSLSFLLGVIVLLPP